MINEAVKVINTDKLFFYVACSRQVSLKRWNFSQNQSLMRVLVLWLIGGNSFWAERSARVEVQMEKQNVLAVENINKILVITEWENKVGNLPELHL